MTALLILASLASPQTEQLGRASGTVLVMNVRPVGVSDSAAALMTTQVAAALAAKPGINVISVAEIDELAAAQKNLQAMDCRDDTCIAELARIANAPLVVSSTLGQVGSEYILTLSLVDSETSSIKGSAERSALSLDGLVEQLGTLASDLFGAGEAASESKYELPEGESTSFAVFDIDAVGVEEELAVNLTQILAAEAKRVRGASVISSQDIVSMLELQSLKVGVDCDDDVACLAEIGGALGVDKLIIGQLGKLGERYVISLRLVDARRSRVENRVNEMYEGIIEQLAPAIRHAGRRLLGLQNTEPGELQVALSEPDAIAMLDGKPLGQEPTTPVLGLAPGRHSLALVKSGFHDWRSDFYIGPGGVTNLRADMLETPTKWVFWGFLSVAAAAIAGATITGALYLVEDGEVNARYPGGSKAGADGLQGHINNAQTLALTTNVFWVSSGVLTVGTLIAAVLTDWD